jgi:hypothetical protein
MFRGRDRDRPGAISGGANFRQRAMELSPRPENTPHPPSTGRSIMALLPRRRRGCAIGVATRFQAPAGTVPADPLRCPVRGPGDREADHRPDPPGAVPGRHAGTGGTMPGRDHGGHGCPVAAGTRFGAASRRGCDDAPVMPRAINASPLPGPPPAAWRLYHLGITGENHWWAHKDSNLGPAD